MTERGFALNFDLRPCSELDQYALLARQDYNFGDREKWFGDFRGGLYGMGHRLAAVKRHCWEVHNWIPVPREIADAEYHLSSILFNMDSAIECFTFALNALGYSAYPNEFRDITDPKALRSISPRDIMGVDGKIASLPGYARRFPLLRALWLGQRDLFQVIADCHDVSKHRSTIFSGGRARMDASPGFYEALGVGDDPNRRSDFWPMEEITFSRNVKQPYADRYPTPREDIVVLEDVARCFTDLVDGSVKAALGDAKVRFVLPVPQFRESPAN